MKVGRISIVFAIFGAIVILSAAFSQPVSAKTSGQVDIIKRYDRYTTVIREFGKDVANDQTLKSLIERLMKNEQLNSIAREVKDAKTPDQVRSLAERFVDVMENTREYRQIESVMKTKYGEQINTIRAFVNELQSKPNDAEMLFDAYLREMDAFVVPVAVATQTQSGHLLTTEENVVSGNGGNIGCLAASTSVAGHAMAINGQTHQLTPQLASASTVAIMRDMNGNIYIWIPGYGWFPGMLFLYLCAAIYFIIGAIFGVPGVILSSIGTLLLTGAGEIWNWINSHDGWFPGLLAFWLPLMIILTIPGFLSGVTGGILLIIAGWATEVGQDILNFIDEHKGDRK